MTERLINAIWQHLWDAGAVGGGAGDEQDSEIQGRVTTKGEPTSGPNNCT